PRLLHSRPYAVQAGVQPDRRDQGLVMDELLDPLQGRLAPFLIELGRLFPEEAIDVGIAPVHIGAARRDKGLDPGGRFAEGAAATLDESLVLLVGIPLEESHPLDWSELHADAG